MSKRLGMFNGINRFLQDSLDEVQYATGALYTGGAGAAYGVFNGATSDHTTVMGGAVGGALTGAAAGAAIAYGANKSAGIRNVIDSLGLRIGGLNEEADDVVREYKAMREAGNVNYENIGASIGAIKMGRPEIDGSASRSFMETLARRFTDVDQAAGPGSINGGYKKHAADHFNNIKTGHDNYFNRGSAGANTQGAANNAGANAGKTGAGGKKSNRKTSNKGANP